MTLHILLKSYLWCDRSVLEDHERVQRIPAAGGAYSQIQGLSRSHQVLLKPSYLSSIVLCPTLLLTRDTQQTQESVSLTGSISSETDTLLIQSQIANHHPHSPFLSLPHPRSFCFTPACQESFKQKRATGTSGKHVLLFPVPTIYFCIQCVLEFNSPWDKILLSYDLHHICVSSLV